MRDRALGGISSGQTGHAATTATGAAHGVDQARANNEGRILVGHTPRATLTIQLRQISKTLVAPHWSARRGTSGRNSSYSRNPGRFEKFLRAMHRGERAPSRSGPVVHATCRQARERRMARTSARGHQLALFVAPVGNRQTAIARRGKKLP